MQRAPTAWNIVPSRLYLLVHVLLALAVVGVVWRYAALTLSVAATLVLVAVLVRVAYRRPRCQLRAALQPSGEFFWSWRETEGKAWQPITLRCDYLGPWLIGLRVNGRRLWIWPDSCSACARWELRRHLIQCET